MPIPPDMQRSYLGLQVGSLLLSRVSVPNPMGVVRAAAWHNHMLRLGLPLPLFVVHDLGLLMTAGGSVTGQARPSAPPPELAAPLQAYDEMLRQLERGDAHRRRLAHPRRDGGGDPGKAAAGSAAALAGSQRLDRQPGAAA